MFGKHEQLEVRHLSGSCTQARIISYLDTLAERCRPEHLTVVVLDNAPFHKGKLLREQRSRWEAQGLYLRYLLAYSPQLVLDKAACSACVSTGPVRNPIESVWRRLKGFLMPRRCYDTLTQLSAALKLGLKALNAINI